MLFDIQPYLYHSPKEMKQPDITVVTGIGTGVGKSYATGWLARQLADEGRRVTTIKMIQTGNVGFSEDIEVHRRIMGVPYSEYDRKLVTAPIIMSYPASPHLAAHIDGVSIDLSLIDRSVAALAPHYDTLLIEVAGGLMVPITEDYLTIDYIKDEGYPTALVVNGQLGSINHILLSLEALSNRHIEISHIIYNAHFDEDKTICDETRRYVADYVRRHLPSTRYMEMPANL